MPNRILRDTALDSDRIAAIDEPSEILFYRLIMLADDYGRFDGRLPVIRSRAFALRQSVTEREIERRLSQLTKNNLIIRYTVENKPYIEILRFGQRQRAEKSKFPAYCQSDVGQPSVNRQSSAAVVVVGDVVEVEGGVVVDKASPISQDDLSWLPLPAWKEYQQHRKEIGKPMKVLGEAKTLKKLKEWKSQGYDITEILGNAVAGGYQGLFVPKGNGKNKQEQIEERNRRATSGWKPPEMRSENATK